MEVTEPSLSEVSVDKWYLEVLLFLLKELCNCLKFKRILRVRDSFCVSGTSGVGNQFVQYL